MKIVELTNSIKLPVSNEEYTILRMFKGEPIAKRLLTARQQHVANQLVNKDLLIRINDNGQIFYKKRNGI